MINKALKPHLFEKLGIGLVLLCSVACSADVLPTQAPLTASQNNGANQLDAYVEDFLPFIHFNKRHMFTDMLGQPESASSEPFENYHAPGQIDLIETMTYQDLEITLYKIARNDSEVFLLGLSLTGPGHEMKSGIKVGSAISDITDVLGKANTRERQGSEWVDSYCDTWTGQTCLYFHHDNTTVKKIVYESYFD